MAPQVLRTMQLCSAAASETSLLRSGPGSVGTDIRHVPGILRRVAEDIDVLWKRCFPIDWGSGPAIARQCHLVLSYLPSTAHPSSKRTRTS